MDEFVTAYDATAATADVATAEGFATTAAEDVAIADEVAATEEAAATAATEDEAVVVVFEEPDPPKVKSMQDS